MSTEPMAAAPATDPVTRLLTVYRRIYEERMKDLPFVNKALEVDVVGFRPRGGRWSGALITPWFINFVILPKDLEEWSELEEGSRRRWRLGGSEYEFFINVDDELGHYQTLAVMAPVTQLADQEAARAAAMAAIDRLLNESGTQPPEADSDAKKAEARQDGRYRHEVEGTPRGKRKLDRRGFFRSFIPGK